MGILSRMSTVFKSKANAILDAAENPAETLEYSYEKQLDLLRNVKRNLADVVASKKRLELQSIKLKESMTTLEGQAVQAVKLGREDLATAALEKKQALQGQIDSMDAQIKGLEQEQEKLSSVEARLQAKVEAFRTKKEVLKAQYSASTAQVKIGEAATGLSEELADVGLAVQRAEEKTEKMRARAAAIDELVESGVLEDSLGGKEDRLGAELRRASSQNKVQEELARLKGEVGKP